MQTKRTSAPQRAATAVKPAATPRRSAAPQPPRQLRPWQLLVVDIVLIGLSLVVFALFDHVIPVKEQAIPVQQASVIPIATSAPAPTELAAQPDAEALAEGEPEAEAAPTPEPVLSEGDFSVKFADKFTDGEVIQTDTTYQSANLNITLNKYTFNVGNYEEVAYVQDIYVRRIDSIRRCFAKDTYGKAITEGVLDMANRSNAIAAINGDYYGHNNGGIVICNGVMYRDRFGADIQTVVLFRDGTMKCYQESSQFDAKQVMEDGAWQSWSFGPIFLNGDGTLNPKGYKNVNHDPRTIIGMVEPGHYMFIVVDGRQNGYSEGLTYAESAEFCQKLGLVTAFNLDGGKTSQMTFLGKMASKPYKNGRGLSDIAYVAEP